MYFIIFILNIIIVIFYYIINIMDFLGIRIVFDLLFVLYVLRNLMLSERNNDCYLEMKNGIFKYVYKFK